MMFKYPFLLLLFFLAALSACQNSDRSFELRSGDLLFRGASSGHISQAIDQVTQTSLETHFSHMGMVEVTDSGIFVLHADPEGGTCRISLNKFLHPPGDPVMAVAYRLKGQWQKAIPAALQKARQMLGKPYNFSYILNDSAHYCSEFVYLSFVEDSIFELNPMTFKNPKTGSFDPAWIDYYQKLGMKVPEGMPGCNPNGIAASDKLERLGTVN